MHHKSGLGVRFVQMQQGAHTAPTLSAVEASPREEDGSGATPRAKAAFLRKSAKRSVAEMLWYASFLTLFSFATMAGKVDQSVYWFGDAVMQTAVMTEFPKEATNVLKTLYDTATINDVYAYLEGVLYPFLYTGATFNGTYYGGRVLGVAYLAGPVRLGTLRVKRQPCASASGIHYAAPPVCYGAWASSEEELSAYGVGGVYKANRDSSEPSFVSTVTTHRYPAPAYNVVLQLNESTDCTYGTAYSNLPDGSDLPANCPAALAMFGLQRDVFLDSQTRALFVDINVWHPQLRHMAVVRILFELLPAGGVTPWAEVDVFRPYPYSTAADRVYLVLDLVVLAQVFIYIGLDIKKLWRIGAKAYVHELANVPHVLNLALFIVVWIIRLDAIHVTPNPIDTNSTTYLQLRTAVAKWKVAQAVNSFNMFLCWVKMFKYMAFMPQFAQLTRTLRNSASRLGSFFLIIIIVIVGSAQAFFLAFGTKLQQYRNIQESIYALVRALLMDFSLQELRNANLWLGPLFFGSFIILAVFVLLNMFIAIISDAYSEVRRELERAKGVEYGTIIMHVIVHDWIYHIPVFGPWLRRFMGWADKQRRKSVGLFSMLSVAPSGPSSSAVISDLAQMALINSRDPKEKAALQTVANDIQAQRNTKSNIAASLFPDRQTAKVLPLQPTLPTQPSLSAALGAGGFEKTLQDLERLGQLASSVMERMQQQRAGIAQPGLLTDLELLHATSLSIPALSRTSSRYAPDSDADDHASPEYMDGKLPRPAKKAQRVRDPSPRLPGSPDRTDAGDAERSSAAGGSRSLADDEALMSAASLDTDAEEQKAPRKKKKKHRKPGEGSGSQALDIEMGHVM